ncbi:MAG TPA: glycosyltransferase, partial [Thermoanaerobaculia bacterium]|nr:glycosyltransferase [Thermoanaerobaculia bacterium]
VLAVAKMSPREAPWDLVRALPGLSGDVRVLFAGDGPRRAELAGEAGRLAPERAGFLGYIPYRDLPVLYGLADLFVHPVSEERWGVSVAEALACGLPVVTSSRVGAAHDLLVPGKNGAIYAVGQPAELAQRISEALQLDRGEVERTNRSVLARWDYAATWRSLVEAATRAANLPAGDFF